MVELLTRERSITVNNIVCEYKPFSQVLPGYDLTEGSPLRNELKFYEQRAKLRKAVKAIEKQELSIDDSVTLLFYQMLIAFSDGAIPVLEILFQKQITLREFRNQRDRCLDELPDELKKVQLILYKQSQLSNTKHGSCLEV